MFGLLAWIAWAGSEATQAGELAEPDAPIEWTAAEEGSSWRPAWTPPVSPPSPEAQVSSASSTGARHRALARPVDLHADSAYLVTKVDDPASEVAQASPSTASSKLEEDISVERILPAMDGFSSGVADTTPVRRLVIPALEIDVEVMGVPFNGQTWDLNGLGGKIAYLEGTSWPSIGSNTGLAGHLTARGVRQAPFRYLHRLRKGDLAILYTDAFVYTYHVREMSLVKAEDLYVLAPTTSPQLTMLTCWTWDDEQGEYLNRRAVFADLVRIEPLEAEK